MKPIEINGVTLTESSFPEVSQAGLPQRTVRAGVFTLRDGGQLSYSEPGVEEFHGVVGTRDVLPPSYFSHLDSEQALLEFMAEFENAPEVIYASPKTPSYNPTGQAISLQFQDPYLQKLRKEKEQNHPCVLELNTPLDKSITTVTIEEEKGRSRFVLHTYWQHTICDFGYARSVYRLRITLWLKLIMNVAAGLLNQPKSHWLCTKS